MRWGAVLGVCVAAWLSSPPALAGYTIGLGIGYDVATTVEPDGALPRPRKIYATLGDLTKPFNLDSYSYDGTGNISAIGTDTFGYDARSRLVYAGYPSSGSQGFSYDRFGNMTSRAGVSPQFFTIDASTNHVVGYDYLRGNLTGPAGSPSYAWDDLDRMTSQTFGSWTYLYNAENERIGKQPQGLAWTFTLRDPEERVSTEFAGSTPSRDNVFLGNLLVASYANTAVGGNSSPWSFYSSDHLGTPRLITHIDVADSETHKFWPYGDEVTPQSAPQRLRFAAMEADSESNRFYDHARHHDFGLARFISPDQLAGKPGDAQSWNRYAYARNNPLKYVDPNGKQVMPAGNANLALAFGQISPQEHQQILAMQASGPRGAAAGGLVLAGADGAGLFAAGAVGAGPGIPGLTAEVFNSSPAVRGRIIESVLGSIFGGSLPSNFPTIDRFLNGVATSVKSMDLMSKTYQSGGAVLSRLTGYVDKLAAFSGGKVGDVVVRGEQVAERVLELVVPSGATPEQLEAVQKAAQYAASQSVRFTIFELR